MAVRQYIGARYVTKIYENSLTPGSAEWEAGVTYEPLTLVTYNFSSYLSKKEVPAIVGNPAANPSYWVVTGAYNGQIANLQDQINEIKSAFVTPEMYGAKGDGGTDDTGAIQDALNSGKNVVFTPGNVYVVSSKLTAPNTCKIYGNWATLSNVSDTEDTILSASYVYDLIINGGQKELRYGIEVEDVTNDAEIIGCTVHGVHNNTSNCYGVVLTDRTPKHVCKIALCHVYDIYSKDNGTVADPEGNAVGIAIYAESDVIITQNVIHNINSSDDGYGIYVGIVPTIEVSCEISNNYLYDINNTGIKTDMPGAYIHDNDIHQDPVNGTRMTYGIRAYGNNMLIQNNHFEYSGTSSANCIFIQGCDGSVIDNNSFNVPHAPLHIIARQGHFNDVTRNEITTDYTGAQPVISHESQEGGTVAENIITTSGDIGIKCNTYKTRIKDNVITCPTYGLHMGYGDHAIIEGNRLTGQLYFSQSCNDVIIKNNVMGMIYGQAAVHDFKIVDNTINDVSAGYGIRFVNQCHKMEICGNTILNPTYGIKNDGANINTIMHNIIPDAVTPITSNSGKNNLVKFNFIKAGTAVSVSGSTNSDGTENYEIAT